MSYDSNVVIVLVINCIQQHLGEHMPSLELQNNGQFYVSAYSKKDLPGYTINGRDMRKNGVKRAEPIIEKGTHFTLEPSHNVASEFFPDAWIGNLIFPRDLSERKGKKGSQSGEQLIASKYYAPYKGVRHDSGVVGYTSTIKDCELKIGDESTRPLMQSFYKVAQYYENLGRFSYIMCHGDSGIVFKRMNLMALPDGTIVLPGHIVPSINLVRDYEMQGKAWAIYDGSGIMPLRYYSEIINAHARWPGAGIKLTNQWKGKPDVNTDISLYDSAPDALEWKKRIQRNIDVLLRKINTRKYASVIEDFRSTAKSTATKQALVPDVAAMSEYLMLMINVLQNKEKIDYYSRLPMFSNVLLDSVKDKVIKIITTGLDPAVQGILIPTIRYPDSPERFVTVPSWEGGRYPLIQYTTGTSGRYPFTGSGSTVPCNIDQKSDVAKMLCQVHPMQYRFTSLDGPPKSNPQITSIWKGVFREEDYGRKITALYPNGNYEHYEGDFDAICSVEDCKCVLPEKLDIVDIKHGGFLYRCNYSMLSFTADYAVGWVMGVPLAKIGGTP